MKMKARLLSLLLACVMALSFAAPAAAAKAEIYSAVVRFESGADAAELCRMLEDLPGVSVRWEYEALFSGAAVEGSEAALARVKECAGISSVAISRSWVMPAAAGDAAGTSNSLDVMNAEDVEYNGDGTVIAVIDSGLYLGHEAFQDYGILKNPAISAEDVELFTKDGGTEGRYVSVKIPFVYDYSEEDRSVHSADPHGTHVAALAAGYALNSDGSVKFRGVAPAAQILGMKVFGDENGARDTDIIRAMEDAYLLGADVVNLSLGSEGDFLNGDLIGELYQEVIEKLRGEGVIVCCAAGNSATAITGKPEGVELPTADFTDYGTACVPASYPGATAVAAVNAASREGGGGILVGNAVITYQKAVGEETTDIPPDLDDFAGKTFDYVVIGGLGSKADFEGLDLTGCVALVQRGELLFSEKTNNAAAVGAVACLIYNNEPGAILPAVSDTTIPCAVITREGGEYMIEQAENGRGTLRIEPNRVMVDSGEGGTMMADSSWGATSDLRLVPVLTAPGGGIYSAINGGQDQYEYMSGTSMAAPNASGSFAILMQALEERGVTDRSERAELAEDLLTGSAEILTSQDGVYLSPRQQGAGVIDLQAALESDVVIRDSVISLGESEGGVFNIRFTVENLSDKELRLGMDVSVLTDLSLTDGVNYYSGLAPCDITDEMFVYGEQTVVVPAEGKKNVTLTLAVSRSLKERITKVFINGFFVEGYVTLSDEEGRAVHATFMGYCGDWEAAPVFEQVDFRDVLNAAAAGEAVSPVNTGYNSAYPSTENVAFDQRSMLGENPWGDVGILDERMAITAGETDAMISAIGAFSADIYTLRNAAHLIMIVSDRKTGEIYLLTDAVNVERSDVGAALGQALPAFCGYWDGTDRNGADLPSGTQVDVAFYAWTESDTAAQDAYERNGCDMSRPESYGWLTSGYFDDRLEWEFPLVLDGEAPKIISAAMAENGAVEITVADNEFLAYAVVQDEEGNELAREVFASEIRGDKHILEVMPGENTQAVYITLVDYAGNSVGLEVFVSAEAAEQSECWSALFKDVRKSAWYHEAVDYVCENGLMDQTKAQCFEPERFATRADVLEALYRIVGEPGMDGVTLPFMDVKIFDEYYAAVQWAYVCGIADGYTQQHFGPVAPVSRQQMAVMLYRTADAYGEIEIYDKAILDDFKDADAVDDWAREAMAWAVGEGLLSGDAEGNLDPTATAKRAELAQILMNITNKT